MLKKSFRSLSKELLQSPLIRSIKPASTLVKNMPWGISAGPMHHLAAFAAIFAAVAAICFPGFANGLSAQTVIDSPLLTEKIGTNMTIKVDLNGNGDFTSVQEAINSVPKGNTRWVIIHLRKGVYR